MKGLKLLKSAALSLACCGVLSSQLLAAGPATKGKASTISDVALAQNGTLVGQLVDKQGRGVHGAVVSVKFGNKEIARTVTNGKGLYRVKGLRGGVHQVVAGRQSQVFRFWNAQTAPPAAKNSALTVLGSEVARGQAFGGVNPALVNLGIGAGTLTTSVIAAGDASDASESSSSANTKIDALQQQVNNLPSS